MRAVPRQPFPKASAVPSQPAQPGPELSTARHLSIAGLAAVGVSFGFARYGYGLFLPDIRAEYGLSMSTVGMIGSATYVGYLVALVLVGALSTRAGPRALVVIGGLSATVGTGLVALAPNTGVLAAGLVLAGMSPGWTWAPYSDAVKQMVQPERQQQVLAIIPTGTAFGVVVAGPLALVMHGTAWRYAWLVFAAGAVMATLYNARVLPSGPGPQDGVAASRVDIRWFVRRPAVPLYMTATSYGVVGSVYWLLAVDAISTPGGMGANAAALFWTLIGAAGVGGVLAGAVFEQLGLRRAQALLFASLALAVTLLGVAPGALVAVAASALLYGPNFMAVSALLAVWSYRVFPDRPTTGFSATALFLAVGTILGPVTIGTLADRHGMRIAFLVAAAVSVATLVARPEARPPRASCQH